ncbi:type II toxin-antitoxin system Phd/YefM family antitoxin [Bifidobacterium ruminantium]|uniref:type II toxin-antitoxin system Phd/YefM family antitoxin n=1 Tax=Bifidobacterium ruminantium TaxID=78346 RepID=UPI002492A8D1|nr:type II toxin-antitoxin system Phd/YefM family antitoxin [Bifidobacterium ruminantium]
MKDQQAKDLHICLLIRILIRILFDIIEVNMVATSILDNMVSVTSLNHGGASKALSQVGDDRPVIVLKNNRPSAVIITPDDYRRLTQAEENFALYREAMERLRNDDGTRLTDADVFGENYHPIDDGFEPEFE